MFDFKEDLQLEICHLRKSRAIACWLLLILLAGYAILILENVKLEDKYNKLVDEILITVIANE